jgi:calcium-translocating P-type ATPase
MPIAWHALTAEQALAQLEASPLGLAAPDVAERQARHGPNRLPEPHRPTPLEIFARQFASPLVIVLVVAGAIAALLGDYKDAGFIAAVVLLDVVIGAVQEWRAEQSAASLRHFLVARARVMREGAVTTIPSEQLVPGDIVLLESGDRVPADLRLLAVTELMLDEAFLTGESLPVHKAADPVAAGAMAGDRRSLAYAGATVSTGRARGVVIATGTDTEVGRIAVAAQADDGARPPLVIRMERFARQVTLAVVAFGIVLGTISLARGMVPTEVFVFMIAMAVSAIPEGLPVAMTVALSLASRRMAARHVIVRRLDAVESLGSCTVVASDKTGTLTVNQQTVRVVVLPDGTAREVTGEGYRGEGEVGEGEQEGAHDAVITLARAGLLCNEAALVRGADGEWTHSGDAMDVALLALAWKLGLDPASERRAHPLLGTIPFESVRRWAAVAHDSPAGPQLALKGAVEDVVQRCDRIAGGGMFDAAAVVARAEALAADGYRVLAVARGDAPSCLPLDADALPPLAFLGLAAFIDPVRPEAPPAIATAQRAGVRVVMITGDHPLTSLAIARTLGLTTTEDAVCTGLELRALGDPTGEPFRAAVMRGRVFARVAPEQKVQIVQALQAAGEFVAVTGDGVNDAPALRTAHLGVAMGSGTDVARDTAAMIVTDDNIASIVAGIEEGRFAYANVRKVTLLLVSTSLAEMTLIAATVILGLPLPLLAVQILWLNLVTNGIQDVALAFEAGEEGVMDRPPVQPSIGIFDRAMITQVLVGGLTMAVICFGAWLALLDAGTTEETARAMILALLVVMQSYHVFSCRSEWRSAFRVPLRNNRLLVVGAAVALGIHVLATEMPLMQSLLGVEPLPFQTWATIALLAAPVLLVMEAWKRWRRAARNGAVALSAAKR